jgi:hypothetical protein
MNYRIDLVVLSHSFYQTEFFTHIQKPKEASHSRLAALGQFLRDPAGVDEELYVFLAKKVVREYVPRWRMDHDLIERQVPLLLDIRKINGSSSFLRNATVGLKPLCT